jgi:hypothetical protein
VTPPPPRGFWGFWGGGGGGFGGGGGGGGGGQGGASVLVEALTDVGPELLRFVGQRIPEDLRAPAIHRA